MKYEIQKHKTHDFVVYEAMEGAFQQVIAHCYLERHAERVKAALEAAEPKAEPEPFDRTIDNIRISSARKGYTPRLRVRISVIGNKCFGRKPGLFAEDPDGSTPGNVLSTYNARELGRAVIECADYEDARNA